MFLIDQILLASGVLMVLGTISSKFSARVGLPVLVAFIFLGMLAGEEGPGGIVFDNYKLAHAVGTVALAFILFDGGLQTSLPGIKLVWKPAALLASVGVLVTSIVTGLAAAWVLDIPLLEGVLLGSIIGSTDAAAVFALLRSAGVHLKPRLSAMLEIESGSNDPMAIFLTIGLLEVLTGEAELGFGLLQLFAVQMGVGAAVGFVIGKLAIRLINGIRLGTSGLYPVLTCACGVTAFGLAAVLGGSGYLAVYVAGIMLGNSRVVFLRGTLMFHDGLAWAGQISMFVVLGLLATPSELLEVGTDGLLVAAALVFVARPLAVAPVLLPFRFSLREVALVSWVGLKGAVPIILATFPLLFGLPSGKLLFDVVFFVVLVSAVVQGSSISFVARLLGLEQAPPPEAPFSLEISSLSEVDADILQYPVAAESRAAGRRLSRLALPDGAVVAMIARDKTMIPPRGTTQILAGDHVFVVLRAENQVFVDRVFSDLQRRAHDVPIGKELPLPATITVRELEEMHDITIPAAPGRTLEELVAGHVPGPPKQDAETTLGKVMLRVREVVDARVASVGVTVLAAEGEATGG